MCDLKVAPMIGALVVSTRALDRVPPETRASLGDSAKRIVERLRERVVDLDRAALLVMKNHGLVVHDVPANMESRWRAATSTAFSDLAGTAFSEEAYRMVEDFLREYRAGSPRR